MRIFRTFKYATLSNQQVEKNSSEHDQHYQRILISYFYLLFDKAQKSIECDNRNRDKSGASLK